MGKFLDKTTKQVIKSLHTPTARLNPNLMYLPPSFEMPSCALKYLDVTGTLPREMTVEEKAAVDAAETALLPTPEEIAAQKLATFKDACWNKLRACDWTRVDDVHIQPPKKQDWSDYREALRELYDNTTDPDSVVWPEEPE